MASYDVCSPLRRWPPPSLTGAPRGPARRRPRPPPSRRSTWSRSPAPAPRATAASCRTRCARVDAAPQQDAALAGSASPAPVYRWTTALNGVAVRLTAAQAAELAADPRVAPGREERGAPPGRHRAARAGVPSGPVASRGGAGTVVGVVDTGICAGEPAVRRRSPAWAGRRAASTATAWAARTGTPTAATPSWSAPAGSSTASAPTTCAPPPRSPRATTTATAPRWPPSPPATPGCRCAWTTSGSAATAASPRRPGWRSTRPAGWRPTPPTTAARPPTW